MKDKNNPMGDFASAIAEMKKNSNPRDSAFQTMSENIWKPEMRKLMHRFDKSDVIPVIQNIITIMVVEKRWAETKATQKVIATKKYPFYTVITEYKTETIPMDKFIQENTHYAILNDIIDLYIGVDGQAREEVFGFITSYAKAIEESNKIPYITQQ